MSEKKVWLVTGAGRGLGVDIARAALAAGHAVVASGRNPERVMAALGSHDELLVVALDVTDPAAAEAAVRAAVDRFGRLDVLVNNAGNFNAGFFEQLTPARVPGPDRDHAVRSDQPHPRGASDHARPAFRAGRDDLLDRRHRGRGVPDRVRRVEVRGRGLAGVAGVRGRAVRHPDDAGRAGLLPDRAPDAGVDEVRRGLDRGLRRTDRADGRRLAEHGRASRAAILPSSPLRWSSSPPWTSRRCASRPAPTRSPRSRTGPSCSSTRPTPTASCPATSTMMTPDVRRR